MHGFQKGVKFPARIRSNKRRLTVARSRVEWQRKSQAFMEIGEEDLHLQSAGQTNKAGVPIASGHPQCLYVK